MPTSAAVFDLRAVRSAVMAALQDLQDRDGPIGCYRMARGKRPDLYSSLDAALIRVLMGEDLGATLSEAERQSWADHINSFARRRYDQEADGSYEDTYGHSLLHANGMVIGALGPLGGRQAQPVRLYKEFDTPEKVGAWLDGLDWSNQWRASHLFWGGLHCFSFSRACNSDWREAVFAGLTGLSTSPPDGGGAVSHMQTGTSHSGGASTSCRCMSIMAAAFLTRSGSSTASCLSSYRMVAGSSDPVRS